VIYLPNTTDSLDVVTSAAATVDVNANFIEAAASGLTAPTGGRQNTAISTATTTTVLSAPGSTLTRTLKQMTIRNKDASNQTDVTVRYNQNGSAFELHKETLLPGYALIYIEGIGFFLIKPGLNDNRLITSFEQSTGQRAVRSALAAHGVIHTFLTISGTAYYVYMGRATQDVTIKFVEFQITTAGAGTDTKEVGLFSTPSAPNKSNQTLTKIVATGTVDAGTSTGVKRNTASFAQLITKGTHLWAAFRGALSTTQITTGGLAGDMAEGEILTTTGGGALTGLTTASGVVPSVVAVTLAPDLAITQD
jgi:hypothetical protein